MSNPILGANVATQSFASVVVTLPDGAGFRGRDGIAAGIEKLRDEAKNDGAKIGFVEGFEQGSEAGYQEGLRRGQREAAEAARVEARLVGEALAQEVGELHSRVETAWQEFIATSEIALTDRCLDTVRALLGAELQISRDSALSIVRRCIEEVSHATSIRVRVASSDLPLLTDHLRDGRVELVADDSIDAGCIVESSAGTVDGTIGTTLHLLENAWTEAA